MATFRWLVMLLACNLIGLFDEMCVTAAPAYDSIESQNSDAINSTSEVVISNTHEKDAEGTSGDETAEKGNGDVINTEDQGDGGESGDTGEHPEIASNPQVEGTSGDETAEKGDGDVINTEDQGDGDGRESGDTGEHPEIASNPHANDDAGKAQNVSDEEERGNEEKSSKENEDKSLEDDTEIKVQNFPQGARSYMPLQPSDNITSNGETNTNFNYLTENTDVPAATEISPTADNESNVEGNATENLDKGEGRQLGTSAENATTSVTGSENKTQIQRGNIKQVSGEDTSINEPGLGNHRGDSESSASIGSYIVLGVIMAIIVMLLGYSVFKGRGRRAQETKNEDFGTEMSDVRKNLLPQNDFKGEIQPKTHLEEDESKAKLLPDAQRTGDNIQNGEAGVAVQNGIDNQKKLGGIDDAPTEKKFDLDKIESQIEPVDSIENTLNSQNQNSTNPFRQAVTPKKQETADGQITYHQSLKTPTHQKAYNNVNGVPEAVVETVPVQMYSGYVTQNSSVPAIPYGLQQQNMGTMYSSGPPVKVVTVVEEGCTPTKPVIVNVESNVFQH